nr:hypothetical protein [Tanacetum cinerariifolium]
MDGFRTYDDEVLLKKCHKNCLKKFQEISREIDEAKLQKAIDEMFRQRCNSGEEHQYHVDQMQNYFKNNIVLESRKESDSFMEEIDLSIYPDDPMPPGIEEYDDDSERDILILEELLDNYSLSFPDSDSFMEEIDLSIYPDDPMPPGIEEDDDDSERDILILEELLDNYSLSFPVIKSYHFDIPSFSRPPAKPPDVNTGILNIKMMGDISNQKVPMPGLMITLVPNLEKSPDLLSHRGLENFQLSTKCPMMIYEKNIHILDVPLFHFTPLINSSMGGIGSSSAT